MSIKLENKKIQEKRGLTQDIYFNITYKNF